MIAMACWILRYVLFAFGAPDQITWMLLLGVVVHGICYDFFFVTGFMYTDQKAPVEIRGQAQGLLVFLTQGVGMFIGYKIMGAGKFLGIDFGWTIGEYGQQVSNSDKYVEALTAAQGKVESTGFFESFGRMFSRDLPEKLNQELVIETMTQWKNFWMLPAIMAFIILVVFAATFWDNAKPQGSQDGEPSEVK
jgi:hypothetical protein